MTSYRYLISESFPNHQVASDRFTLEIDTSPIAVKLDHISTVDDECFVVFRADLSQGDKRTLDNLVQNHSGEPLPQTATPVSFDKETSSVQSAVIRNVGYSPDPNSYTDGTSPSAIDGENNQQIRGQVLTDETSYRDDFPGIDLHHEIPGTLTFTQGSTIVTGEGTSFRADLNVDCHVWLYVDGSGVSVRVSTILSEWREGGLMELSG